MNGFFKSLFGKPAQSRANGHAVAPTLTPPPPAANAFAPAPPAAPVGESGDGGGVRLPVQSILPALPLEFKARVQHIPQPNAVVVLTLEEVLSQLPLGAVKIQFGRLRACAPDVFSGDKTRDHILIALPLDLILARVNPGILMRRPGQKKVDISEEISSPFGNRGQGLSFGNGKSNLPIPSRPLAPGEILTSKLHVPPVPPAHPLEAGSRLTETPLNGHRPPASDLRGGPAAFQPPAPAQPKTEPIAFRYPAPPQPKSEPIPFRNPVSPAPAPTVTPPVAPPTWPAMPSSRGGGDLPLPAAPRDPTHFAQPVPPPTGAAGDSLPLLPLAALAESWPDALKQEIAQLNLGWAQIALPAAAIEPALRTGRASFTWKMLRSWIRPATLPTVSAHDNDLLDLPLKVVAPLFLQHHSSKPRRHWVIDESIPNLFFGFPQPAAPQPEIVNGNGSHSPVQSQAGMAPPPAASPEAPTETGNNPVNGRSPALESLMAAHGIALAPAPAAAPVPPLVPPPSAPEPFNPPPQQADSNYYVWNDSSDTALVEEREVRQQPVQTDFLSRHATPNDVVRQAAKLEGVAGALVALPDGLMVASQLPTNLNGDTLAAFVPQIYGKVSQASNELRMGPLNNLSFTVGNIPWKIFRVNAIFFAAFGQAGRSLPTVPLAALAGQLDRKK